MNYPEYIIERHKHGWLVKPPPQKWGIPMDCLTEILPLMPKNSVVDGGLAGALQGMFAIGSPEDCKAWRKQIADDLEKQPIHAGLKWLRGCDTGLSALTIFITLIDNWAEEQEARGKFGGTEPGHAPSDADDFGRCQRLLDLTPPWKNQLHILAEKFPDGPWPRLVKHWPKLEALYKLGTDEALTKLNAKLYKLTDRK